MFDPQGEKREVREHEKNISLHFEVLLKWVIENAKQKREQEKEMKVDLVRTGKGNEGRSSVV